MKRRMSPFEEAVLMAVGELTVRNPKGAYGVPIKKTLCDWYKGDVNFGSIYTTLERMERKGYVSSIMGDPTPERGGKRKRYFKIEATGVRALQESRETSRGIYELFDKLWGRKWKKIAEGV